MSQPEPKIVWLTDEDDGTHFAISGEYRIEFEHKSRPVTRFCLIWRIFKRSVPKDFQKDLKGYAPFPGPLAQGEAPSLSVAVRRIRKALIKLQRRKL